MIVLYFDKFIEPQEQFIESIQEIASIYCPCLFFIYEPFIDQNIQIYLTLSYMDEAIDKILEVFHIDCKIIENDEILQRSFHASASLSIYEDIKLAHIFDIMKSETKRCCCRIDYQNEKSFQCWMFSDDLLHAEKLISQIINHEHDIQFHKGNISILSEKTMPKEKPNGIVLGKDIQGDNVVIDENDLNKHMFIAGSKLSINHTIMNMADSLWQDDIPFLIFDTTGMNRKLALFDINELLIFSPENTNLSLRINPFEFPKGVILNNHIDNLCRIFETVFSFIPPVNFIIERSIEMIYETHGWNKFEINTGEKEYPILLELYSQLKKELLSSGYDDEIVGHIRVVLDKFLGQMLKDGVRDIFDTTESILSPEQWLEYPAIIELNTLTSEYATFITLLICTYIKDTKRIQIGNNQTIRHMIFIENMHHFIRSNEVTFFLVRMLAEVSYLKEGFIITDESLTLQLPELIKNIATQLIYHSDAAALLSSKKLAKPLEVFIEAIDQDTPTDDELLAIMLHKDEYKKLSQHEEMRRSEEIEKFKKLRSQVILYYYDVMELCQSLDQYQFDKLTIADFRHIILEYDNHLKAMESLKLTYLEACSQISKSYVDSKKIDKLIDMIYQIYRLLQRKIKVICYKYTSKL